MMDATKVSQLELLERILPEGAEVRHMLTMWKTIDARYWGESLEPCWLTSAIEPYGAALGSWCQGTRTLNLIPRLFREDNGLDADEQERAMSGAFAVMIHEACHQAQCQFFGHLNGAKGPRGKWFDLSHRCPAWARACWEVIQKDDLPCFVPVWHRGSKNQWSPWVPTDDSWMQWKRVDPDYRFDGRELLDPEDSKRFPIRDIGKIVDEAGLPMETAGGKPIDWTI